MSEVPQELQIIRAKVYDAWEDASAEHTYNDYTFRRAFLGSSGHAIEMSGPGMMGRIFTPGDAVDFLWNKLLANLPE